MKPEAFMRQTVKQVMLIVSTAKEFCAVGGACYLLETGCCRHHDCCRNKNQATEMAKERLAVTVESCSTATAGPYCTSRELCNTNPSFAWQEKWKSRSVRVESVK